MGYQKLKDIEFVYEYDFAVDGGAVGDINLRPLGNALEAGLVIKDVTVFCESAFAGEATPTVTCGNEDDRDGYFENFYALGTLNGAFNVGSVAGDLLWDDTNDHRINYRIPDAGAAVPSITVGSQALTAGKLKFIFTCVRY